MPGAEWFPGAQLNYAEHVFRGKRDSEVALRHASELRSPGGEWTWGELGAQTAAVAAGLRELGVGPGDRVAAYMPNIPETVAAFLACASIGAVWSSAAPEFGARSVIDRFSQIEPKVLLAVDGYRYGGRDHDRRAAVDEIAGAIASVERVVRMGYLDGSGWEARFIGESASLEFEPVAFDHPLWVLYSSGTTGLPKPIVHGHGGILIEQLKKGYLHLDAQPGDRLFWFSTTGWMMWNFLIGVLLTDASIILFDGNPGYPDMGRLWDLAEETGMTTFGTSAAFISSCMKAGVSPRGDGRSLANLQAVGSTGSPLSP
jgi:acetoacetyl-CoA synthetase